MICITSADGDTVVLRIYLEVVPHNEWPAWFAVGADKAEFHRSSSGTIVANRSLSGLCRGYVGMVSNETLSSKPQVVA